MAENVTSNSELIHDEDIATKVSQEGKMIHKENDAQLVKERRRRSERLKDTNLTTMEKNDRMAQKRNLEGNSKNPKPISVLPIDEIIHITANMGVAINSEDFETFDLIRDLEKARDDLYLKQCENKLKSQIETVEIVENNNNLPELEWLDMESSESEDFMLVESRKERRESKKSRRFSPLVKSKKVDQEDPSHQKKKEGGLVKPTQQKFPKLEKNDKFKWSCVEL